MGLSDGQRRVVIAALLALGAGCLLAAARIRLDLALYVLYIGITFLLGASGWSTLVWMLHAWRTPGSVGKSLLPADGVEPMHSFSLIVPARHEESVLEGTLSRLVASDHPDFEVLVVVGDDDHATRAVAERVADRHPDLVRVIVDDSLPKNKPKALNTALPYCTRTLTGVFDAEDDVHPALLRRVDQCFRTSDADVVQAGVQLMNHDSSWLTGRNVLEYYFWFRSRLTFHAGQGFIPLGGNTVFVRTEILQAVSGWDGECLAEDCELGVRLSSLGAHTVVFYEPELVTREECPPTLGAFARQRTRWNQGYLQTLAKGYWRRLPPRQRALGLYTLTMPYLMALAWVLVPIALFTAVAMNAPVPIVLISYLPALPMASILAVELAALGEFCRAYGKRASARDYGRLVLALPLYQAVLAYAAARAVVREARGSRGWEKTAHLGLHLNGQGADGDGREEPRRAALSPNGSGPPPQNGHGPRVPLLRVVPDLAPVEAVAERANGGQSVLVTSLCRRPSENLTHYLQEMGFEVRYLQSEADSFERVEIVRNRRADERQAYAPGGELALAAGDGRVRSLPPTLDELFAARGRDPLWIRLEALSSGGSASQLLPRIAPPPARVKRRPPKQPAPVRLGDLGARAWRVVASHPDVALLTVLLAVIGVLSARNCLHWPGQLFDEGTYVGNAWAVQHGALAPYTYSYGHPPLAWLAIFLWTGAGSALGIGTYSIDAARDFMVAVSLVGGSLVYVIARRMHMGRPFAAGAVVLFTLCPLALYFHRAVLLDNLAIVWALAAFALALTPRRRLWAFAASGACFALAVLSKETILVILPALLLAAAQNTDRRTRRYCLTLFGSFFLVIGLAYPLYAVLKGELLPGPAHVSLFGEVVVQLFTRETTGNILDPQSPAHATVVYWLKLDPWLLGSALALTPIALVLRKTRAVALAYVIQLVMVLRPGYLPAMYVIALVPFAALMVAGTMDALWRMSQRPRHTQRGDGLAPVAFCVLATVLAFGTAPRWAHDISVATTVREDGTTRAVTRWIVSNKLYEKRMLVGDEYWIYLVQHGADASPVRGGFFSRTIVSFWPFDYDPAVRKRFPNGWRDFEYIVSTQAMRASVARTPETARALAHSRPIVTFGRGEQRIEVRKIDPALGPG
jgi:cellulose synthase/poly-beta-1,6-N-acetylglucosamine synthase-like glycosyltransferase